MDIITLFRNLNPIKQGIKQPKKDPVKPGEYETYVDPKCGCTKTRKKVKPQNIEENETDVTIHENGNEEIRTKDEDNSELLYRKSRRSTKTKINKS